MGSPVDVGFGNGVPLYAGLALTSHNDGIISTATLDNLFISGSFEYDLQNFSASVNLDKTVTLDWVTTVESNLEKFTIEHSSDNINFTDIESVAALNQGHFTEDYSSLDSNPSQGFNYYRLRMMTVAGIVRYSVLATVWISSLSSPTVYPNPVTYNGGSTTPLTAYVAQGDEEVKFVNVYDISGRAAFQITNTAKTGITEIPVSSLSNGVYIVEIITAQSVYKTKLVVRN